MQRAVEGVDLAYRTAFDEFDRREIFETGYAIFAGELD